MIFETERLTIRKLHTSDSNGFFDMQSNSNVMQHIKKHMNRSESEKELNRFINYYDDPNRFFKIWAVETKESSEFIGICGVYKNDRNEFEIAYRLRELFWGNGYGKEIAQNLIKHCFKHQEINKLTAYVRAENIGSIKILQSEMKFEKEFYCKKSGCTEWIFELKIDDYLLRTHNSPE